MRKYFVLVLGVLFSFSALAQTKLPGVSEKYLPLLGAAVTNFWPEIPNRAFPAGVIMQESLWKERALLKTSREVGCGLGQFTKTYTADGKIRFDTLSELTAASPALKGWNWNDCYNVNYQLKAVVIKLKMGDRDCRAVMRGPLNQLACDAAKYNGGSGSVSKRIRFCQAKAGCNPREWFNHLEKQCPQSNKRVAGYGESFCEINSKYPGRVFKHMLRFDGKL